MWRGKVAQQIRAKKLRSQGRSVKEISQRLHVSKSSVSVWVRSVKLTKLQQRRLQARMARGSASGRKIVVAQWHEYRKNHPKPGPNLALQWNIQQIQSFFSRWTKEMAYVLGFFAADGCMYHSANGGHSTGGYYNVFNSTDLQLLRTIRDVMSIHNKIEAEQRPFPHKTKYIVRIVSKKLYEQLLQLGMTPSKSLTLRFPNVPDCFLSDFVRGYFDGDGCVYFARLKRGDSGSFRNVFMVRFTSGSRKFLEVLQQRLSAAAGTGRGSLHPHTTAWDLAYSTNDARHLYNFMYPSNVPCLERKKQVFERAFKFLGPVV